MSARFWGGGPGKEAPARAQSVTSPILNVMVELDPTTLIALAGIVVSGVLGPWVAALMARKSSRQQFTLDQGALRREELQKLLDEAAELLGAGVTHVRRLRETADHGDDAAQQAQEWLDKVFPLGQRLRLRLPETDKVVTTYDAVRERLVAYIVSKEMTADAAVQEYEVARNDFLKAARQTLGAPISVGKLGRRR